MSENQKEEEECVCVCIYSEVSTADSGLSAGLSAAGAPRKWGPLTSAAPGVELGEARSRRTAVAGVEPGEARPLTSTIDDGLPRAVVRISADWTL
jgi:hypothetical protein